MRECFNEQTVPIFSGHEVGEDSYLTPKVLRRLFQRIAYENINTLKCCDLPDLIKKTNLGIDLPCLFTFDDGYKSDLKIVFPLAREFGVQVTFFINPTRVMEADKISSSPYLNSEEVRRLAEFPNVEIGSHCFSHCYGISNAERRISTIEFYSTYDVDSAWWSDFCRRWLRQEIVESRRFLQELTGSKIYSLSWPYGKSCDHAETMAAQAGYSITFCELQGKKVSMNGSCRGLRRYPIRRPFWMRIV
ncbi:MAG: polysaccharide deacetylase family protein [Candidatus Hodarchaeota archaeon]